MSRAAALLDTPLAASLDCAYRAMTHTEREEELVEMPAETRGRLRGFLLDELWRDRP